MAGTGRTLQKFFTAAVKAVLEYQPDLGILLCVLMLQLQFYHLLIKSNTGDTTISTLLEKALYITLILSF